MAKFRGDDPNYSNHSPKDLYDPRDPHIYRNYHSLVLRHTMGAKLHEIWCDWAMSMIQQNMIDPNKVDSLIAAMIPFHNLPPEVQREHLLRSEKLISEFLNWKMVDRAIAKGGPRGGAKINEG